MRNLTIEQKNEFKDIFEALGESLDITKTQYDNLTNSYRAVGEYLEKDLTLSSFNPTITPQGSLRLGTIIQPINPDDDLDVDLVFRLQDKPYNWTQKDLKEQVGRRIKSHGVYSSMLKEKEGGRRCWTLLYRDNADNPKERYHMDILPAVADKEYAIRMLKMSSAAYSDSAIDQISIRITDRESKDYSSSPIITHWLKSNPDGYALWFTNRCRTSIHSGVMAESVIPFDKYTKEKTVLQRIVQILKRHRDIMFANDKEDKPISIIITTLAAKAYNGEQDLVDGLINVAANLTKGISKGMNGEDWIGNPVNSEENFADKWPSAPKKRRDFYKWTESLQCDLEEMINGINRTEIFNSIDRCFGHNISCRASELLSERRKASIAAGTTLLSSTGVVGSSGKGINTTNTFYGK